MTTKKRKKDPNDDEKVKFCFRGRYPKKHTHKISAQFSCLEGVVLKRFCDKIFFIKVTY